MNTEWLNGIPTAEEPKVTFIKPSRQIGGSNGKVTDLSFQYPDHCLFVSCSEIRAIFIDHRDQPRIILAAYNTSPLFTSHPLCERTRLIINYQDSNTSEPSKVAVSIQNI